MCLEIKESFEEKIRENKKQKYELLVRETENRFRTLSNLKRKKKTLFFLEKESFYNRILVLKKRSNKLYSKMNLMKDKDLMSLFFIQGEGYELLRSFLKFMLKNGFKGKVISLLKNEFVILQKDLRYLEGLKDLSILKNELKLTNKFFINFLFKKLVFDFLLHFFLRVKKIGNRSFNFHAFVMTHKGINIIRKWLFNFIKARSEKNLKLKMRKEFSGLLFANDYTDVVYDKLINIFEENRQGEMIFPKLIMGKRSIKKKNKKVAQIKYKKKRALK